MVDAGGEIFVFWFYRTQENAFPDASLRFAKNGHYSAEKRGDHGPRLPGCVSPVVFKVSSNLNVNFLNGVQWSLRESPVDSF